MSDFERDIYEIFRFHREEIINMIKGPDTYFPIYAIMEYLTREENAPLKELVREYYEIWELAVNSKELEEIYAEGEIKKVEEKVKLLKDQIKLKIEERKCEDTVKLLKDQIKLKKMSEEE